jgi:hypothetical protein
MKGLVSLIPDLIIKTLGMEFEHEKLIRAH